MDRWRPEIPDEAAVSVAANTLRVNVAAWLAESVTVTEYLPAATMGTVNVTPLNEP